MLSAHLANLGNPKQARAESLESQGLTHHTTISVVVTNRPLPFWALQRLAVQVHTSMARGEQPLAEADDGDTLFAVTTGGAKGVTISDEEMDDLGMLASEAAWDAILSSLPPLPVKTIRTNVVPSSQVLDGMVGHYVFATNAIAQLRSKGPALEIEMTGPSNNYFTAATPALLTAIATDEFEVAGPREDRLRIDRDEHGMIVGITLNPGLWAIHATRK